MKRLHSVRYLLRETASHLVPLIQLKCAGYPNSIIFERGSRPIKLIDASAVAFIYSSNVFILCCALKTKKIKVGKRYIKMRHVWRGFKRKDIIWKQNQERSRLEPKEDLQKKLPLSRLKTQNRKSECACLSFD